MPSAAILNGGQARRFDGRDKGALDVAGRSIRARQLQVLAAIADDVMIIGGASKPAAPGAALSDAGDAAAAVRVRWLADRQPGLGPLAGLDVALQHADHGLVVVVACDMPGVTAALLQALLAHSDGADVVVPRSESGYHPLCAVYRAVTCRPVVAAHLAAGDLAVKAMFPRLRVRELSGAALAAVGDPRRLLANVNTPAEHEALATLLAHES